MSFSADLADLGRNYRNRFDTDDTDDTDDCSVIFTLGCLERRELISRPGIFSFWFLINGVRLDFDD
jgi:hypothetical protein